MRVDTITRFLENYFDVFTALTDSNEDVQSSTKAKAPVVPEKTVDYKQESEDVQAKNKKIVESLTCDEVSIK